MDRHTAVECIKTEAEDQEEGELQHDDGGVKHERALAVPARFAPEETLHQELICAVGGHGEKGPAQDTADECIRCGEEVPEIVSQRKIDEGELVGSMGSREADDICPAIRKLVNDDPHRRRSAAQIDEELHHIHRDDRLESAEVRIRESEDAYEENAGRIVQARDEVNRNGGGEKPDAGCENSCHQEDGRREFPQGRSKPFAEEIVRGLEIPLIVRGDEDDAHQQSADEVAERKLEKMHVAGIGETGNADKREGAGFTCDDRKADRPPRHFFAAKEIVARAFLFAGNPRPNDRDTDEVDTDDGIVQARKTHIILRGGGAGKARQWSGEGQAAGKG